MGYDKWSIISSVDRRLKDEYYTVLSLWSSGILIFTKDKISLEYIEHKSSIKRSEIKWKSMKELFKRDACYSVSKKCSRCQ